IGRVFGQEEQLRSGGADELTHDFASVAAEIVHDDDVAGAKRREENLLHVRRKLSPSIGPSINHGASIRSWRKAARKVIVFQRPCGTLVVSLHPRGAHPRKGAISVLVQVSSMKTRRSGSTRS